jgi:hypothetical protein
MTSNERVDQKKVVIGAPILEPADSSALVFLRPGVPIIVGTGKSASLVTPFGLGDGLGSGGTGGGNDDNPDDPKDPNDPGEDGIDKPELSDIEEIVYEQYFDANKTLKYNAILKVRNSSKKKDQVIAVDARNTPAGQADETGNETPSTFVTPIPTTPSVIFDRTGTAIAWGWNNSTGLGSYTSITYEWEIRSSSSTTSTKISSGTKTYASSGSYAIGDSGKNRTYRVSSGQGDTPATSSARWLRVRAVVVGTNGKKYYSSYSKPI